MLRNCRGKLLLRPSPFARHETVLVRSWSLMSERLNSVVKVSPPVVSARDSKGQLSISMDRIGPSAYGVITLNQYDEASTARCARDRVSVCHHARRSVPVAGQDQFQICPVQFNYRSIPVDRRAQCRLGAPDFSESAISTGSAHPQPSFHRPVPV